MRLVVLGTGYVGLVTGSCFSEMGHHVVCIDINPEKINNLLKGILPIYEPHLEEIVKRNVAAKRLDFSTDIESALTHGDAIFIAVNTPSEDFGACDLSFVKQASFSIGTYLHKEALIILKSTVPVGTAKKVKGWIQEKLEERQVSFSVEVASNPEFLKEGSAVEDFMKPDRIVIGTENEKAALLMKEIYKAFTFNHDRLLFMDLASAELTKYAANAMLALRISFMNELSHLAEKVHADINAIRLGIGSDRRIGYDFLYAGVGYGGSCFPKDLRALQKTALDHGCEMSILEAVEKVNEKQKQLLFQKISSYFAKRGGLKGKRIAIWGLAFKPNTDDMREAPALSLIASLQEQGAVLSLYDPIAMQRAKELLPDPLLSFAVNEYVSAEKADAIALVTEWKQFRFVDFEAILKTMNGRAFFDGRNQYNASEMKKKGFDYHGIGIADRA